MDSHKMAVAGLDRHYRQSFLSGFRQSFRTKVVIFAVVIPCRIIAGKVVGGFFRFHLGLSRQIFRNTVLESYAVVVGACYQGYLFRESTLTAQFKDHLIEMVIHLRTFSPYRFPHIAHFSLGDIIDFPTFARYVIVTNQVKAQFRFVDERSAFRLERIGPLSLLIRTELHNQVAVG